MAQIVNTRDFRLARRFYKKHGFYTELEYAPRERRKWIYYGHSVKAFYFIFKYPVKLLEVISYPLSDFIKWARQPLVHYSWFLIDRWVKPGFYALSSFIV